MTPEPVFKIVAQPSLVECGTELSFFLCRATKTRKQAHPATETREIRPSNPKSLMTVVLSNPKSLMTNLIHRAGGEMCREQKLT